MPSNRRIASDIEELLNPSLEAMGFELVRLRLLGSGGGRTLEIMAERPDGTMTIDDCAEVSKTVAAILDIEDPIPGEYVLEVTSPGIDRPLTREKDFERFRGFEARIDTIEAIDGKRRIHGCIDGLSDGQVVITGEDGTHRIAQADIRSARLVATDDLIRASLRENSK